MDTTTVEPTMQRVTVSAMAGIAVAAGLAAGFSRWLSRDLVDPLWVRVGVVLFSGGAVWWGSWRRDRRIDPVLAAIALVLCGTVAWAAWVPAALVLPQSELLAATRSDEATARALDHWSQIDGAGCVQASQLELGVLGDLASWREVCAAGTAPDGIVVTYRPQDPHLLTIVHGPGPGMPGTCARQLGDRWWAVPDHVPGEPRPPCRPGFTFTGA